MRFVLAVLAFIVFATPSFAQESEMDRAEAAIRDSMASSGASVERAAPNEIRVRMPSDITFDFDRADVRYEFRSHLRALARTLLRYPSMSVDVVGHADAVGSDGYNQALSERRARSVGAALMDYGVSRQSIEMRGMGEWEPIATNATAWGRAQNRRVEIHIKAEK